MRTILFTALVMMLSACGLNQSGTDNTADSKASADSTELPVVQQPAETANGQMQSMDSEAAAMEAASSDESAQASDSMESSEPAMADMEPGKDMQPEASTAGEGSDSQDKVSDKTKVPESPDQKS
ncbi:MAG: hypothetical protein PVJ39_20375 [Gammaproteobacteria bacterium]